MYQNCIEVVNYIENKEGMKAIKVEKINKTIKHHLFIHQTRKYTRHNVYAYHLEIEL